MRNPQIPKLIPPSAPRGSKMFSQRMEALLRPAIRLIGDGECEASPSHSLDKPLCWDMNGFYRRLGVPTDAHRSLIRQAYLDKNGSSSSALTKAVEVLTNKRTRPLYDSLPFGWFWPDDEALIKMITNEEFQTPGNDLWAFYVSDAGKFMFEMLGADAAITVIDEWRVVIAYEMWLTGYDGLFAMGVGDEIAVAYIGKRIVCFIPLTVKATVDYASRIVTVAHRMRISSIR